MTRPAPPAIERVLADACLGGDETLAAMSRDLGAFLRARGVAEDDVEAIEAAPRRLTAYRSLVRNGIAGVVARLLPRTRARLDAACPGRFDADLAGFLVEAGPRTHYLRDVPGELVGWAEARWRAAPDVPSYLPDLALHEIACFRVSAAEDDDAAAPRRAPALDRPLALSRAARRADYRWTVHLLGDDDTALPEQRDVRLLGYRDGDQAVRWLELSPLAATIVDHLAGGRPLGKAVEGACVAHRTSPADVSTDVARLLADLGERGAVLGAP